MTHSLGIGFSDSLTEARILHLFHSATDTVTDDSTIKACAHDYLELGVITDGVGIHLIDDQMIPCKTGDLYIVPPGVPHGYYLAESDGSLTVRTLRFFVKDWFRPDVAIPGSKRYCYGVFQNGGRVAYAMLNSRMSERVSVLLDEIECELAEREDEWETALSAYLLELFILLGRYINRCEIRSFKKTKDWEITCAAMKIVEEEFGNFKLSLDAIAARLFVSASSLSRIFKIQSGHLFSEYLRDVRLNCAARLLVETDATVDHIVLECGFRDVSSFYRNFRDTFGMPPQAYKQFHKNRMAKNNKNINSLKKEDRKMEILREISENVQKGKAKLVKELVAQAIEAGAVPEEILNQGLLAGMGVIGEKFKNNEVYVPEVLVAARAMSMGTQILKPYLVNEGTTSKRKVCIGTVQGDLHDIGKNLVKMMMEGKGFEVVDLGTDVAPEAFVKAAIEENCQIICCSALLTTTMSVMGDVVKAAEAAGIRDKVKIMVGGAPINEEFCRTIGADCYTPDAASAADAAVELLAK